MAERNQGDLIEVGAFWAKKGNKGTFFAGELAKNVTITVADENGEEVPVTNDLLLFRVENKKNPNMPDLRLMMKIP